MQESQWAKGNGAGLTVEIVPLPPVETAKIKGLAQNPAGKAREAGLETVGLIAEAKGLDGLKASLCKLSPEGRTVKKTQVSELVLLTVVDAVLSEGFLEWNTAGEPASRLE